MEEMKRRKNGTQSFAKDPSPPKANQTDEELAKAITKMDTPESRVKINLGVPDQPPKGGQSEKQISRMSSFKNNYATPIK